MPSIYFTSDVFFEGTPTLVGNSNWYLTSANSGSYTSGPNLLSAKIVVDVPITFNNANFHSVNIVHNAAVTYNNCIFLGSPALSSTMNTGATISGNTTLDTIVVSGGPGITFTVTIPYGSTVYLSTNMDLSGNTVFVNNGTFYLNNGDFYSDSAAWFVNLGLWDISGHGTISYGTTWTPLSSSTSTNTPMNIVNMGTMQFSNSGYINGAYGTTQETTLYQCNTGVMKLNFGYPTASQSPTSSSFGHISLDGVISVIYSNNYPPVTGISSLSLFSWDPKLYTSAVNNVWNGSLMECTSPNTTPQLLCYDTSTGIAYLFASSTCGTGYGLSNSQIGACSSVRSSITSMTPSCPRSAHCGFADSCSTTPNPTPTPTHQTGSSLVASILFGLSVLLMGFA